MTESEAIKWQEQIKEIYKGFPRDIEEEMNDSCDMAIQALEKQEKIKETIANANKWIKEDIVVKAQAFCDIEKILRSDEE